MTIVDIVVIILVISWFRLLWVMLSVKRKDNPKSLYKSLAHDGCQYCKGKLSSKHSVDVPYHHHRMIVECDGCYEQYKIDYGKRKAWRV